MIKKNVISRRFSLLNIGLLGTVTALGTTMLSSCARKHSGKATALAIIGDRYHNSDYIRTALGKTIVREAGVSIDFTDETQMLSAENLKGYKLVIIFRDGMIWPEGYIGSYAGYVSGQSPEIISEPKLPEIAGNPVMWIKPEQGLALRNFVNSGGSALFYHNSSHISLANDDYRDVEGAVYTGHPEIRAFWVRNLNKNHPITKGVNDFLVVDEQHYVDYQKDPKFVLMRSENADGISYGDQGASCEACWAYDYGKGRVCFMAPGHMITALWNPEYVKLQKNAVKWLLKEM